MFQNTARQRRPSSYQLDAKDYPALMNKARLKILANIREADESGALNEFFGPHEISLDNLDDNDYLDYDFTENCAGIVYAATARIVDYVTYMLSGLIFTPQAAIDLESGEIGQENLPKYAFDIGPKKRHFPNLDMADAKNIGSVQTHKLVLDGGIELDVLIVEIPDESTANDLLEAHREVQAEILSEKSASLMWIFQGRWRIVLVSESSRGHTWNPQQWFRKILSDIALANSIMVDHRYYWNPVVQRRLTKALKQFKKLFRAVTDQDRVIMEELDEDMEPLETTSRVYRDKGKLKKTDVYKYKSNGKDFVKAMEYFPHTRTRIMMGNFSSIRASIQPMADALMNLFQIWVQHDVYVKKNLEFIPLRELVDMEEEAFVELASVKTIENEKGEAIEIIEEMSESEAPKVELVEEKKPKQKKKKSAADNSSECSSDQAFKKNISVSKSGTMKQKKTSVRPLVQTIEDRFRNLKSDKETPQVFSSQFPYGYNTMFSTFTSQPSENGAASKKLESGSTGNQSANLLCDVKGRNVKSGKNPEEEIKIPQTDSGDN